MSLPERERHCLPNKPRQDVTIPAVLCVRPSVGASKPGLRQERSVQSGKHDCVIYRRHKYLIHMKNTSFNT